MNVQGNAAETLDDRLAASTSLSDRRQSFDENGYVIIRKLIPSEMCDELVRLFNEQVKPYPGEILRFPSFKFQRNVFNSSGHLVNHITELQGIQDNDLKDFVDKSLDTITSASLISEVAKIIGETPTVTQTVYFEGGTNPTPLHHDLYYSPCDLQKLAIGWIALEDINPDASRFCIYPKSHGIQLPSNIGDYSIKMRRGETMYLSEVSKKVRELGLDVDIPIMQKGDVVLFDGKTIHGSLKAKEPKYTRHSMTTFFIPESAKPYLHTKTINGIRVAIDPMSYTDKRVA